jgi:hypothetical protein
LASRRRSKQPADAHPVSAPLEATRDAESTIYGLPSNLRIHASLGCQGSRRLFGRIRWKRTRGSRMYDGRHGDIYIRQSLLRGLAPPGTGSTVTEISLIDGGLQAKQMSFSGTALARLRAKRQSRRAFRHRCGGYAGNGQYGSTEADPSPITRTVCSAKSPAFARLASESAEEVRGSHCRPKLSWSLRTCAAAERACT